MKTIFSSILIVMCLMFCNVAWAAEAEAAAYGVVKGRVVDVSNNPVEYATATLLNAKSGELVMGEVCNDNGEFTFSKVRNGEYLLCVSMVGFERYQTEALRIDRNNALIEQAIVLREASKQLNEVLVVAKRDYIEQTADKLIINPDAAISSASESVYDILKKAPGVTVDNNDNISLKGMQGVKILIDDKPTHLSTEQLAAYLKGIQGKSIERIEIIEQPSARYDAEGNAGIINIKTKHIKARGFNGSVNAGLTLTRSLGENAGLDLNMNYGKLNLYANYSFYDWKNWYAMHVTRRYTSPQLLGAYQLADNETSGNGISHNLKLGADYYIAKNHVVSFMYRMNDGFNDTRDNGATSFFNKNALLDSMLVSETPRRYEWHNKTMNVNYKWDIDTLGQSLVLDADYARYGFGSNSDQSGRMLDAFNNVLKPSVDLLSSQNSDIDILSFKLDYVLPLSKTLSFESGAKMSFVSTSNVAEMLGYMTQSDNFAYDENIYAAYVNGRAKINKTSLQLGLRAENTVSRGVSHAMGTSNDKQYLKLFPSVFVQQELSEHQTLGMRYSYRIGRPRYSNLNPFIWMLDPYTYNQGNPDLAPQFTHAASINHNYKSLFMSSVAFNYTTDLFSEVLFQDDETKVLYQTMDNLSSSLDLNFSETIQLKPTKWWSLNATATLMYKKIDANFAGGVTFERWSYMANMNNSFTLPWRMSAELSGNYMSKQLLGNFVLKPTYRVNIGIQRPLFDNKAMLRANVNDIFNTGSGGAYAKYGNVDMDVVNFWESRRFNLSFSYRFGNNDFKTRANRSTASSEEAGRSGNN